MSLNELNSDQRREVVNTRQRFDTFQRASDRVRGYRGSMVWGTSAGREYLYRSSYDENNVRRQKALGRRGPETEDLKSSFDRERAEANQALETIREISARQAAINRAIGLGRVPLTTARILRNLDGRGLLGAGIRVAGTNAIYAYEAACGVMVDPSITTTEDIDLLYDARRRLFLVGDADLSTANLVDLLRKVDRSFARTRQSFRASNDEGYLVDLIQPMRNPPWTDAAGRIGDDIDLEAASIEGLVWLENSPAFEQVVIDERGEALRMVAPDPRVFAIHKQWISKRPDRDPLKRRRDWEQAIAVADMVRTYLPHLPFDPAELRMLPRQVVDDFLKR